MKNLKCLIPLSLLVLLSLLALSGCGPSIGGEAGGDRCQTQQDCKGGKVCVNYVQGKGGTCEPSCAEVDASGKPVLETSGVHKDAPKRKGCGGGSNLSCTYYGTGTDKSKWFAACAKTCKTDGDCGSATLTCQNDTYNSGVKICVPKTSSGKPGPNPKKKCTGTDTSVCSSTHPELFACVSGQCEQRGLVAVIIKDLTEDPSDAVRCKVSDAGSDITGVSISSSDGSVISWGRNIGSDTGVKAPGNGYIRNSEPDGSAPTPISGSPECVTRGLLTGGTPGVTWSSLGCGGMMALEFTGAPPTSATIKVYEYDQGQCAATGGTLSADSDVYDVYGCTDSEGLINKSGMDTAISKKTCIKLNSTPLKGYAAVAWPPANI